MVQHAKSARSCLKNAKKVISHASFLSSTHLLQISESSIIRPLKVTKMFPKFNTGRGFARCFTTFQECDLRHTEAFKVSEESTVSCLTDEINRVIFYTSQ